MPHVRSTVRRLNARLRKRLPAVTLPALFTTTVLSFVGGSSILTFHKTFVGRSSMSARWRLHLAFALGILQSGCADPRDLLIGGETGTLGRARLVTEGAFESLQVAELLADGRVEARFTAIEQHDAERDLVLGSISEGVICRSGGVERYRVQDLGAAGAFVLATPEGHADEAVFAVLDGRCQLIASAVTASSGPRAIANGDQLLVVHSAMGGVHFIEHPGGIVRTFASSRGRFVLKGDLLATTDDGQFVLFDIAAKREVLRSGDGVDLFGWPSASTFFLVDPEGFHVGDVATGETKIVVEGEVCDPALGSDGVVTYVQPCGSRGVTLHRVDDGARHQFTGVDLFAGYFWPDNGAPEIAFLQGAGEFRTLFHQVAGADPVEVATDVWEFGAMGPSLLHQAGALTVRANCGEGRICDVLRWSPMSGAALAWPRAAPVALPLGDFDGSLGTLYVLHDNENWRPYLERVPVQELVASPRGTLLVKDVDVEVGTGVLVRVDARLPQLDGPLPESRLVAERVAPWRGEGPQPYAWLTTWNGAAYLRDMDASGTGTLIVENFDDGLKYNIGTGVTEFVEIAGAGIAFVRGAKGIWFVPFE